MAQQLPFNFYLGFWIPDQFLGRHTDRLRDADCCLPSSIAQTRQREAGTRPGTGQNDLIEWPFSFSTWDSPTRSFLQQAQNRPLRNFLTVLEIKYHSPKRKREMKGEERGEEIQSGIILSSTSTCSLLAANPNKKFCISIK